MAEELESKKTIPAAESSQRSFLKSVLLSPVDLGNRIIFGPENKDPGMLRKIFIGPMVVAGAVTSSIISGAAGLLGMETIANYFKNDARGGFNWAKKAYMGQDAGDKKIYKAEGGNKTEVKKDEMNFDPIAGKKLEKNAGLAAEDGKYKAFALDENGKRVFLTGQEKNKTLAEARKVMNGGLPEGTKVIKGKNGEMRIDVPATATPAEPAGIVLPKENFAAKFDGRAVPEGPKGDRSR